MTDIEVTKTACKILRNQKRCSQYISLLAEKLGFAYDNPKDNYILPSLFEQDVLGKICSALKLELSQPSASHIFECFSFQPTEQQIQNFIKEAEAINRFLINYNESLKQEFTVNNYDTFLVWLVHSFEQLQSLDQFPDYDFNSDSFTEKYVPNDDEIKLAINLFGADTIEVTDNNKQLDRKFNVFSNNLWAQYIVQVLAIGGLQLIGQNLPFYGTYLGATAIQITMLQMVFNLVQLFICPLWLILSDHIGRKPIMCICIAWFAVCGFAMTLVIKSSDNDKVIRNLTIWRALQGIAGLVQPMGYTMAADIAPPNYRGAIMIIMNCFSQVGALLISFVNITLTTGKKYSTVDHKVGTDEYNKRTEASFKNAIYISIILLLVTVVFCIIFLRESATRIRAKKEMKKKGLKAGQKINNSEPTGQVLKSMVKDFDMQLLFWSYILSIIGANNSRNGTAIFVQKAYGFGTINEAKLFTNIVQIVCIIISTVISSFGVGPMLKKFGETKVIIATQYLSMLESVINFSINNPIPKWVNYVTGLIISMSLLFCDTIFLQLVSMRTTPNNKGQVMGIFQVGNSIGRILSSYVTGKMMDYNIRDTQILNCLFSASSLILLGFVHPPIQRTEMDQKAAEMKQIDKNIASI